MFCAQCISGYTRSSNFSCAKCPEQWKNILLLVGVFLIALILIVLLVKSTLNAVHSEKSPFAIYIKVMINHLQLIFLTSSFDLSWPDQVNAFYDQTEPVANVSDKVVSLDCFLDGTSKSLLTFSLQRNRSLLSLPPHLSAHSFPGNRCFSFILVS